MASSKKRMQVWLAQLTLAALQVQLSQAAHGGTFGFCQDQVPAALVGTGFNAKSVLNEADCALGGHKWCKLDNTIKEWDNDGDAATPAIEWYYYSGCCNGRTGRTLVVDEDSHLPSCGMAKEVNQYTPAKAISAAKCKRWQWQAKAYNDIGLNYHPYLGPAPYDPRHQDSYDFQFIPATRKDMDPSKYNGFSMPPVGLGEGGCICKPDSKYCAKTTEDGSKCIWCKDIGDVKCDPNAIVVRFGLQFFKLHTVDLKSSLMSFQGWVRADWYDRRLSYDYQCYGGLATFEVQAQAGNLENSVIWVPDFELYNNEEPIWSEQFPSRLAIIYSCWDGAPSRGGCGYVWWSRPCVVKAMCKYGGLIMFPMEVLSCELEIAAWATTGNHQDFMVMGGTSGISWTGGTDEHNMAGIAGGSAFQDYRIKTITARRDITVYNCCPDPFPTLIYLVEFTRANYFYQLKLFAPSMMITLVSFWNFWMDPVVGERLNFAIAVILAITMNDVVATEMMPITDSSLLMDYVSLICMIFAVASLVETAFVLNLYHRTDKDWKTAFMPVGAYKTYREYRRKCRRCFHRKEFQEIQKAEIPGDRRGLFRLQLYKEIFFSLDKNHSGELELHEIESFAIAVLGNAIGHDHVAAALDNFDASANGRLSFDEFVTFCELNIQEKNDINMLTKLLRGYVRAIDREEQTIREMWKGRANMVDTISRFAIPVGFFISLGMVFSMDEKGMKDLSGPSADKRITQWSVKLCGFSVFIGCCLIYFVYWWCRSRRRRGKKSSLDTEVMIESARKSLQSVDVEVPKDEGEAA